VGDGLGCFVTPRAAGILVEHNRHSAKTRMRGSTLFYGKGISKRPIYNEDNGSFLLLVVDCLIGFPFRTDPKKNPWTRGPDPRVHRSHECSRGAVVGRRIFCTALEQPTPHPCLFGTPGGKKKLLAYGGENRHQLNSKDL